MKKKLLLFLKPLASVSLGLCLGLLITLFVGENPLNVLQIMLRSAFGSSYDLGMTLFYATPFIFTGLSVAFSFHAGLFNIGAEGQLLVGSLMIAIAGIAWPSVPGFLAPLFAGACGALAGGLWGAIPGWLRARRGSHEVINTIMFNFIAFGLCSWATLYVFPNLASQNPETLLVASPYRIPHLPGFGESGLNVAFLIALLTAAIVKWILWKTALGYEIQAVGHGASAARAAGIDVGRTRMIALGISGALAGLVGVNEVLGNAGKFRLSFSPGYGFMGIAVALLGKNSPWGVVCAAVLMGALHQGTSHLDLETEHITRDLSLILQALVILCVSAEGLWDFLKKGKAKRLHPPATLT